MTIAQFNSSTQLLLRQQIAITAGLPATAWTQVNITIYAAQRRRMLTGGVVVDVTIAFSGAAAAESAASAFASSALLDAALASVGLPPAQITSTQLVTPAAAPGTTAAPKLSAAPRWLGCGAHSTLLMPLAALVGAAFIREPI